MTSITGYYLGGGDLLVARVLHVGHGVEVVASGEAGVAHAGLQVHCGQLGTVMIMSIKCSVDIIASTCASAHCW